MCYTNFYNLIIQEINKILLLIKLIKYDQTKK